MSIRAAIFDIGGVLTESPVTRIQQYCRERGISEEARLAVFQPLDGPWSRFEQNLVDRDQFALEFEAALRLHGHDGSGRDFLAWFSQGFPPRHEMIAVVAHLRSRLKLGAITNNIARDDGRERNSGLDLYGMFDVVVESSLEGIRKPDPLIYRLACERLGVEPHEAVFLDDLGVNLKGARALGMTTIKVDHTLSAIGELQDVLGFELPHAPTPLSRT